jgi:hypothetical protein
MRAYPLYLLMNGARQLAILLIVLSFTTASVGQRCPEGYVSRAEDLIRKLYPTLDGGLEVSIEAGHWLRREPPNNFSITLCGAPGAPEQGCPFFASFVFSAKSKGLRLLDMKAGEERLDVLRERVGKELDRQSDSSETEVAAALADAGARYGPDRRRELIESLPLATLGPYTGRLTLVSAQFWGPDPEGKRGHPALRWEVVARSERPDTSQKLYTLWFEPFEGRLTWLNAGPEPGKGDQRTGDGR